MSGQTSLLAKVNGFLRIEAGDTTTLPLIQAAKAYLENAGVLEPEAIEESDLVEESELWDDAENPLMLYELAVAIYVCTVFNGGEGKLQAAMTAIILQIKDYGGEY